MRRCIAPVLCLTILIGCAATRDHATPATRPTTQPVADSIAELPYYDQRCVTTRPVAGEGQRPLDAVVRIRQLRVPEMSQPLMAAKVVPPGAKLETESEILVSCGTPFYSTVRLPEQRFEIGGVARRSSDGYVRLEIEYGNNSRNDHFSFKSNIMFKGGEEIVMGCTTGLVWTVSVDLLNNASTAAASAGAGSAP